MAAPRQLRQTLSGAINTGLVVIAMLALLALAALAPWMTQGLAGTQDIASGQGTQIRQILYAATAVFMLIAINPLGDYKRLFCIPLTLTLALAWCWLSVTWAIEPDTSVRRIALTTIVIWTLFAGMRVLTFATICLLFEIMLVALLAANYVAVAFFPEYGLHQLMLVEDGDLIGNFRGIMAHKNIAGAACAVTIIMCLLDNSRFHWAIRFAVAAAAAGFLFYSHSKSSIGIVAFAVMAGMVLQYLQGGIRLAAIGGIVVAALSIQLVAFYMHNPEKFNFEDPKAFTGRPMIWKALTTFISEKPYLGAGYGSFWDIGPTSPIYHLTSGWITTISVGHNGYLDMATQVGIPGLVLVVLGTLVMPLLRCTVLSANPDRKNALVFALLIFCLGHNVTETSLFSRDEFVWIALIIAIGLSTKLPLSVSFQSFNKKTQPPLAGGAIPRPIARHNVPPRPPRNGTAPQFSRPSGSGE